MLNMLEVQYNLNSFYDLAQMLLGEMPAQFEFVYAIVATVLCVAFVAMILGFIGFTFKTLRRW